MIAIDLPFPLRVSACGAVTSAGLAAAPTFAAFRAGVAAFQQTCYRTIYGEPIIGAPVFGLEAPALGREYLAALAGPALDECLTAANRHWHAATGLLLSMGHTLPQEDARSLLADMAMANEINRELCALLPAGEQSLLYGLMKAAEWIEAGIVDICVVGGVDTYLTLSALRELEREGRLKTSRNSDGMIPGEAACFVAVTRDGGIQAQQSGFSLVVRGFGLSAPQSSRRGDGLTLAMRNALTRVGVTAREVGFRPSTQSGESVLALESGIASMRVFRDPGPYPPTWLPAESIGTVGSPVGALLLGWTAAGFAKEYAPGKVALLEFTSLQGSQGALVVTAA